MMNALSGICGKVAPGLCRLSIGGEIAVRTRSGYRSWDSAKKRMTNCDSFVLDIGDDFFYVVPTNHARPGDIILASDMPRCVIDANETTITAVSYEDATVDTLLPEHHIFMGSTYLYGRIVSLFGRNGVKGRRGAGRMMKYMMLSGLFKGREGGMKDMLPFMLMGGKADLMDELFEDIDDEGEEEEA